MPTFPLLELVNRFSAFTLVAVGASVAVAFNYGFFREIELGLISAFTFQEHLVFAFSGLIVFTVIASVILILYTLVYAVQRAVVQGDVSTVTPRIFLAHVGLLIVIIVIQIVVYGVENTGNFVSVLMLLIAAIWFAMRANSISSNYAVAFFLLLAAVQSGVLYAGVAVSEAISGDAPLVRMAVEGEFRLVRMGERFTLVVQNGGTLHAIPTSRVIEVVSANPLTP